MKRREFIAGFVGAASAPVLGRAQQAKVPRIGFLRYASPHERQFEAFRTPDRSIWYRVRPHADWLASIVTPSAEVPRVPAQLAADRR